MDTDNNDILDLIKTRRTIQKYKPEPIDWDKVSKIIDAGRHAPSSGNIQNWKFVVVLDPSKRKALAEAAIQQYWMIDAPVHIVVCADPEKAERYYGVRGERLYSIQNCAAAVQNMLLEAHSLGLGTCWVGAFDEARVRKAITAEERVRPQAIITVGVPAESPKKPKRYPLENITYFESWNNTIRDPTKFLRDYALIWKRNIQKGKKSLKEAGKKIKNKLQELRKESEKDKS